MAIYPNAITRAILAKDRRYYPPDQLANGPDVLLKPVANPAYAIAMFAAWAPALGNQPAPAVDPTTHAVERGYFEELPWDE